MQLLDALEGQEPAPFLEAWWASHQPALPWQYPECVTPEFSPFTALLPILQEVAFFVGSCERPQHLKLVLYAPAGGGEPVSGGGDGGSEGREYVAAGSLGLDALLEAHGGSCSSGRRQHVSVPVVDEVRPSLHRF